MHRLFTIAAVMSLFFGSCVATSTRAEAPATPYLLPHHVLDASAQHFPKVLERLAARRAAEGDLEAAAGAFDLVFTADGFQRATGFWDGGVANLAAKRRLRPLGAEIYGGYRLSDGRFPIYEDQHFTNSGGEAKIGALFSLMRNRTIDEQRFRQTDAAAAVAQADLDLLMTRIGVQHQALSAYWRWVAAGHQLAVYDDLLRLAEAREDGLAQQVRRGARAAIFITENKQNIARRQRLAAEAKRRFLTSANELAFYLRDAQGVTITPFIEQLPPLSALESLSALAVERPTEINTMVNTRPELRFLDIALQRADGRAALQRNELRPQLDLNAEVSHDFGSIAEGGRSRDSTDTIVGLRFSAPLQRRQAKGRLRRAEAERDALAQRRRQTVDEIEIELRNILVNLSLSQQLAAIARQEGEQTQLMRTAEEKRFAAGASDFFLLNIREETAADARIRYLLAEMEMRLARTDFDAAVMDLDRLRLRRPID